MKKSAFISDLIFTYLTTFLFTLCLFRYVGIKLIPSFLLALVCGVLGTVAVGAYLQSKRKELFLKKSDERLKEKLLLHLALLSDEKKTQFFQERLSSPTTPIKRFGRLRIYDDEYFYYLHFSLSPVNADDVLRFSRLKTGKQKNVLCASIEEPAQALAEKLKIEVLTGDRVFALLKSRNALPDVYLGETPNERKRRFTLWLSRANAKRFLVAAALTLFTALFSPFPYYYLLFGGVLLLSALFVHVFGYE